MSLEVNTSKAKEGFTIHRLAAKALIRELEEGDSSTSFSKEHIKSEVVKLGLQYNLATSQTR